MYPQQPAQFAGEVAGYVLHQNLLQNAGSLMRPYVVTSAIDLNPRSMIAQTTLGLKDAYAGSFASPEIRHPASTLIITHALSRDERAALQISPLEFTGNAESHRTTVIETVPDRAYPTPWNQPAALLDIRSRSWATNYIPVAKAIQVDNMFIATEMGRVVLDQLVISMKDSMLTAIEHQIYATLRTLPSIIDSAWLRRSQTEATLLDLLRTRNELAQSVYAGEHPISQIISMANTERDVRRQPDEFREIMMPSAARAHLIQRLTNSTPRSVGAALFMSAESPEFVQMAASQGVLFSRTSEVLVDDGVTILEPLANVYKYAGHLVIEVRKKEDLDDDKFLDQSYVELHDNKKDSLVKISLRRLRENAVHIQGERRFERQQDEKGPVDVETDPQSLPVKILVMRPNHMLWSGDAVIFNRQHTPISSKVSNVHTIQSVDNAHNRSYFDARGSVACVVQNEAYIARVPGVAPTPSGYISGGGTTLCDGRQEDEICRAIFKERDVESRADIITFIVPGDTEIPDHFFPGTHWDGPHGKLENTTIDEKLAKKFDTLFLDCWGREGVRDAIHAICPPSSDDPMNELCVTASSRLPHSYVLSYDNGTAPRTIVKETVQGCGPEGLRMEDGDRRRHEGAIHGNQMHRATKIV